MPHEQHRMMDNACDLSKALGNHIVAKHTDITDPCVSVGFLWVIRFPPTVQEHATRSMQLCPNVQGINL